MKMVEDTQKSKGVMSICARVNTCAHCTSVHSSLLAQHYLIQMSSSRFLHIMHKKTFG